MRKILMLLMLLCCMWATAQDVIVKTDGTSLLCRVVEVNSSEVVYKKWSDLKGSNYVMSRKDISTINYESGKRDDISTLQNQYSPYNQNTGYGQMNDNALARMDAIKDYQRKAKTAKTVGMICGVCGGLSVGVGLVMAIDAAGIADIFDHLHKTGWKIALGCFAGGAGFYFGGAALSNYYQNKAMSLQAASLLQQDIQFNNGTSLALGVDMLRDNAMKNNAVGIGVRYQF